MQMLICIYVYLHPVTAQHHVDVQFEKQFTIKRAHRCRGCGKVVIGRLGVGHIRRSRQYDKWSVSVDNHLIRVNPLASSSPELCVALRGNLIIGIRRDGICTLILHFISFNPFQTFHFEGIAVITHSLSWHWIHHCINCDKYVRKYNGTFSSKTKFQIIQMWRQFLLTKTKTSEVSKY